MSEQNVEAARTLYERFARRDDEAILSAIHPEFELRTPSVYPEGGEVFRGRSGLEKWLAMIDETWAEWRFEPERYFDVEPDVLVLVRIVAEGGSSGIRLDREAAHRWSFRDGRLSAVRVYLDRDEALEAAGVRD